MKTVDLHNIIVQVAVGMHSILKTKESFRVGK